MADVLTPEQRRLNMSRIRGRDTKPELVLRKSLHAAGFRYRLHARELPGRPDMVFPRFRAAIFVHGCFWHGHDCPMFKMPGTRQEFWSAKISGNRARDQRKAAQLEAAGWRILTVWECSVKGPARRPKDDVAASCADFLRGDEQHGEIAGRWPAKLVE
ncbi:very short patch repair endonuclease [Methylobacterium sp. J-068]|uniref:very short patch repair endonuclease n=1 Tax=Methylobacterium sp. J-068 TaxID=2836649 RepID=UPI001FBB2664|nr:very short patch repair endonuclease [Methylobacterium sp. J-068]MCJ2032705.1 very short patch repair endonuclease [Methylobacterium sp. J-068]